MKQTWQWIKFPKAKNWNISWQVDYIRPYQKPQEAANEC